jgi:hypothetical protein
MSPHDETSDALMTRYETSAMDYADAARAVMS